MGSPLVDGVRAVWFDIGETVLDRTREYAAWAQAFGVAPHTFSAVFGAYISAGRPVRDVIAHFRPEPGFADQRLALDAAGLIPELAESDLYPDARPALAALRAAGLLVGVCGNQPPGIGAQLRALALPADQVTTSDEWGCDKPSAAFFDRVVAESGCPADQVLYVGDQLGNDIYPARLAGLRAILLCRGPWGELARDDVPDDVTAVDSLTALAAMFV